MIKAMKNPDSEANDSFRVEAAGFPYFGKIPEQEREKTAHTFAAAHRGDKALVHQAGNLIERFNKRVAEKRAVLAAGKEPASVLAEIKWQLASREQEIRLLKIMVAEIEKP
jgi:hypothetical protein